MLEGVAAAGGEAISFPLLEIEAFDPRNVCAAAQPWLERARWAIFVSPNAVRHGLTPIQRQMAAWPDSLRVAAVGQGTARALMAAGLSGVRVPETGFDSEALLELEEFAAEPITGQDILLFKGEGGRPLMAETLAARGALVHPVSCYRRLPPGAPPVRLQECAAAGGIDAVVVTSSEALSFLVPRLAPLAGDRLWDVLLVATHPRIADVARQQGFRCVLATPPGDAGVLAALTAYNWPNSASISR